MELVIRVKNRGNGGPGDSLAGDVITIMPDGFNWGSAELTNPQWRIIRVPLTQVECDALLSSPENNTREGYFVRRKYKINLKLLPIIDASENRTPGIIDLSNSLSAVRAAAILKK
jgi:hypothetical protein